MQKHVLFVIVLFCFEKVRGVTRQIDGGRGPVQLGRRQRQTGRPVVDKNSHSLGPQLGRSGPGQVTGWPFLSGSGWRGGELNRWVGWVGIIVHVSNCQLAGTASSYRVFVVFCSEKRQTTRSGLRARGRGLVYGPTAPPSPLTHGCHRPGLYFKSKIFFG